MSQVAPLSGVDYKPTASAPPWRARVRAGGRLRTIGRYETVELANQAVEALRISYQDYDELCEHDLPQGTCGPCEGNWGAPRYVPRVKVRNRSTSREPGSRAFEAQSDYRHPCPECNQPILSGQRCRTNLGTLIVHEICPGGEGDRDQAWDDGGLRSGASS